MFLKHVFSLTKLSRSCSYKKESTKGSFTSALKSPINKTFS